MKHLITAVAVILCAIVATGAEDSDSPVAGYALNVHDFRELTVVDGVNVDYRAVPDSAGWVYFSCIPETASCIMFNNNKDHLTIQTTADERPIEGMPLVRVYSSALRAATNSGDSLLRILKLVPTDKIRIKEMGNGTVFATGIEANTVEATVATGCGTVVVEGTARQAKLKNVGTGKLDASRLHARNGGVFVFGSGPLDCHISEKLTVYGVGPGKVRMHIKPEKLTNRSIGVKTVSADSISAE